MTNFAEIIAASRRAFGRIGAWVAGFTFWRFVLFSILVLIAANLVGGLIFRDHSKPLIAVTKDTSSKPVQSAVPPVPKVPAAPAAKGNGCTEDVRVDWSGVHVRKRCGASEDADTAGQSGDESVDEPAGESTAVEISTERERVDFADVALAVLAVLWVAWFVGRARQKAEARADRAEAVAEREGLERQVAEARLQALQAQVEPHFLFNTLGAVEHLIETDPPRAATMQRHLIAFLRGAMPRMRGEAVTLGEEVELCRNYLAIMKIRMEDRLDYSIDLPPELAGASFPPMMLQSVVENAIKHGLEPKAEGGSILISARAAAGRLRVAVADSGLGFGQAGAATAGTGIGLNNIRERLTGLFGDRAALVISPNAPTGAQVAIEIPHDGPNGNHR